MIEISRLTKRFAQHTAVDDLSFSVQPGEVLGFLGPNGAGKSTTMKMLTGFLAPTSGTASIHGFDIQTQTLQAQRLIGYLPEGAPCYGDMRVRGFLEFIAEVRGYRGAQKRERVARTSAMNSRKPRIISTHILEEVTAVCTRAVVIANGRLLADGTPFELESRSRYHQAVTLVADGELDRAALAALPGVAALEENPLEHSLTLLAERGWRIRELDVERGRLDEVFRSLTRGEAA